SACSRAIVLSPIYEPFLARLVEATRSLKVGPADDPAYSVGPVIDDDARRRIAQTIEQGKAEAKLAYAADVSALAEQGCYVGPAIFADVPPAAKLAQEEIFGPVLAVMRDRDRDEYLDIANGTQDDLNCGTVSVSQGHVLR